MVTLPPLAVIALILLHVAAWGYWSLRAIGFRPSGVSAQAVVTAGMGITCFGFEMLFLGHIGGLNPVALSLSSLIMLASLAGVYPRLAQWLSLTRLRLWTALSEDRILAVSCILMILVVIAAGILPPNAPDEVGYHWSAPVWWARAGHWVHSPYRISNGTALAEDLYTFSAVFHCPTAAHWTHTLFLLILAGSCAALARAIGVPAIAAAAACLSCPVILYESAEAYNDVAAAALGICAHTALLASCGQNREIGLLRRRAVLTAGILFAGAVSVKPFMVAALPAAIVYVALQKSKTATGMRYRISGSRGLLLIAPTVIALYLWMLHTYSLTGTVWDRSGQPFVRTSDARWMTGGCTGRLPVLSDILALPIVPVVTSVFGQMEPYGGRTGLLLLCFAPIGAMRMRALPLEQKRRLMWLILAATVYFFVLGAFALKTRYHIFVWSAFSVVAALAYGSLWKHRSRAIAAGVRISYCLLVWLGMADGAYVLLRRFANYHF